MTVCLPLEVETGRWHNVPRENRICKLCDSGEVDEVHFIFGCGALKEIRDVYAGDLQYDFYQTTSYTTNEIELLMTETKVKHFARFLTAMYDARRNIMYKSTPATA